MFDESVFGFTTKPLNSSCKPNNHWKSMQPTPSYQPPSAVSSPSLSVTQLPPSSTVPMSMTASSGYSDDKHSGGGLSQGKAAKKEVLVLISSLI